MKKSEPRASGLNINNGLFGTSCKIKSHLKSKKARHKITKPDAISPSARGFAKILPLGDRLPYATKNRVLPAVVGIPPEFAFGRDRQIALVAHLRNTAQINIGFCIEGGISRNTFCK